MRSINIALAAVILGLLASPAQANQRASDLPIATAAATSGEARPPIGYIGYCVRYPGECTGHSTDRPVKLDQAAWALLKRVNDEVNRRIQPVTDKDHWGVAERWDLPSDGKGDCEDYALLKRKILIEKGFSAGALLMTVVIDREGAGHAVLTVVTDRGDYVLDNQDETILPWTETGYRFVKRQSMQDPNIWTSIGAPLRDPVATAAR
jgi:predicted transglutaminase-like cysteine proteinase